MADDFVANLGSGGDTFGADDVAGVKYPRSKLIHGANGANDGDVSKANPLPVGTNTVKDGSGTNQAFLADSDGHLQIDVVGALPAGTNAIGKLAANSGVDIGDVDVLSIAAGDNNIGNVDIVTVPADPFGLNADAASATGSISAKLRFIASTGIPITGTVTVGAHAVTNAGTFAVQESGAALTALQLIDDAVYVDDADWTDSASKHMLIGGLYQSSQQTITDGDVGPLQVDANGNLRVAIISGAGSGGTAAADDADFVAGTTNGTPAMGVYESSPSSVTDGDLGTVGITQTRALRTVVEGTVTVGSHAVTNAGTFAVQAAQSGTWNVSTVTTVTTCSTVTTITNAVKSVGNTAHDAALSDAPVCIGGFAKAAAPTSVSTDGDAVRAWFALNGAQFVVLVGADGQQSGVLSHGAQKVGGDWEHLDDDAFTPAGARVAMVGFFADETSTDSVGEGDGGAARMTLDRKQIVTVQPHTVGGLTMHKTVSAASTNATSVKGSAGKLYEIVVSSVNAAVRYLKLYDKATAPTVGTDTPVWTIPIPGSTAGAGIAKTIPMGLEFTNGIAFALTTEATDAGTTGVSANEHVVNLGYK